MQTSTEEKPIQDRLLRLPVVLKMIPISKSSWYAGVKVGRYSKHTYPLRSGAIMM
jgi:predicted DNA-binding transcriptional regulator AlpA